MTDSYKIMEDTVRDAFARTVWSHKTQEKQADIYQRQYKIMQTVSIVCASMSSVGILSTIFADQIWIKILSAVLSFITVFVSGYFNVFDLSTLTKAHKESANKLLIARNELTALLMSIKMKEKSVSELENRFDVLRTELNKIYADAPQTTDKAVAMAKEALQVKEDNTFSEEEIDSYLPTALQKGESK